MTIRGPVLFLSDLGERGDAALREAWRLSEEAGVGLVTCHVLPEVVGIRPLFPQLRMFDQEAARRATEWAAARLADQASRVREPDRRAPEVRVESGSTAAAAWQVAEEISAGLVVIGAATDRPDFKPATTAERIARHAGCPVLLHFDQAGRSVLAATDFSDPALPAVEAGREEATLRGQPLYVVHSVDLSASMVAPPEFAAGPYMSNLVEARREEAKRLLEELAARLGNGLVLLREGPAAEAILGAAESVDASLVVVGTHGRSGLSRFALGSVAEGVLRGARRSTLVVPLHRQERGRRAG